MPDMLVKLYDLPDSSSLYKGLNESGFDIRRGIVAEKQAVLQWIKGQFGQGWADECEIAFARQPVSCFIAVRDNKMLGFSVYDSTYKAYFGPTGVDPDLRGKGIGKALLMKALEAMYAEGYAYAIIGGAGPTQFYAKAANAIEIEGSVPGIYRGMLRNP